MGGTNATNGNASTNRISQSNWIREEFLSTFASKDSVKPGDGIDANEWMDKMSKARNGRQGGQHDASSSYYQKPQCKLTDVLKSRSQSDWERGELLHAFASKPAVKPGDGIDAVEWMNKMSKAKDSR